VDSGNGAAPALGNVGSTGHVTSAGLRRFLAVAPWAIAFVTFLLSATDLWLSRLNGTVGPAQLVQLTTLGSAVIGALLASRRPRNPVGWFLCAIALTSGFSPLVWDYGYHALVAAPGSGPFGAQAFWLGNWLWLVVAGFFLPALVVRLPNGHAGRGWRLVDWLAITGSTALVLATALAPGMLDIRTSARNPYGVDGAQTLLTSLLWLGYVLVAAAVAGSVASMAARLGRAHGDEREQIKWIAGSGAILALALAYGFVRQVFFGQVLFTALVPFFMATVTVPISIGVAVLKYRLYEINLIINRALVYGSLTAALAGLYALSIAVTQVLVSVSGQRSEVAILLTAFVAATAFTPLKEWLQSAVDTKFSVRDPVAELNSFRERIDVVVNTLDPRRMARQLVDHLGASFQARFVLLSLESDGRIAPFYSTGSTSDDPALTIPLRSQGREVGVLTLGVRRGGAAYTSHDKEALELCANSVADAFLMWTDTLRGTAPIEAL
jgi:hypothetical protein